MNSTQLSFDFDSPATPVQRAKQNRRSAKSAAPREAGYSKADADYWTKRDSEARANWRVGAVTSLPVMCDIAGVGSRYTYMLPGVIEAIDGDSATVRIYAAPEYGYRLEQYPLHLRLAINVAMRDLGMYALSAGLQRVANAGMLATGDADLAAEIRAREGRASFTHEREVGIVTT